MKILIVGSRQWSMYAEAFYEGFRKLGYNTEIFDTHDSKFMSKIRVVNYFSSHTHISKGVIQMNSALKDYAYGFQPELVFLYSCNDVYPSTVRWIKENTRAIVFTYNNDDPFSGKPTCFFYYFFKRTLRYADVNYVYRKKNVVDIQNIGVNNCKVLYPYYIINDNYYIELKRTIPVSFMGHYEPDGRDKSILELINNGVDVIVFGGKLWERAPVFQDIRQVVKERKSGVEYNRTLNQTKISIIFLSKINHDTYTRRCFEIPVTKSMMLCEYTDDMNELYPEGKCAVYFRNNQELIEKCKYYLDHEDEREIIAENAYNRIMTLGGSQIDRCREILNEYQNLI